MQSERVQICTRRMLQKPCSGSWFVPLEQDASVQDILNLFAQFMLSGNEPPNQILSSVFKTLTQDESECMFVFMRRGSQTAAGILRSSKPLCSKRELELLTQLGQTQQWNIPLWTWTEEHHELTPLMEQQCRHIKGPCMGIWCYR
jgi:hypothetical protein